MRLCDARPVDPEAFDDATRARFWSYVDRRDVSECWPWLGGCTDKKGNNPYGAFSISTGGKPRQRVLRVARVVLALTHERVIYGWACHHCDNTICCNPAHLYEGDARTNKDDALGRGRIPRGAQHPRKILLSAKKHASLLAAVQRGAPYTAIARQLGVSHAFVRQTARDAGVLVVRSKPKKNVTDRHVIVDIARQVARGVSFNRLGRQYDISPGYARRIAERATGRTFARGSGNHAEQRAAG